jgi:hypothetical protein
MNFPLNNTEDAIAAALFNSSAAVDELGLIKAQIAELEEKEKALTEALKATSQTSFKGTFFDCTISRSERANFDLKQLRADLGDELCAPYVKAPTQVVTLKLTAKK